MPSPAMLRRVALVITDVSEEQIQILCIFSQHASVAITANVPSSSILVTLMMEELNSSETSVVTRVTRRNIPGGAILHSHRRENLKSYSTYLVFLIYKLATSTIIIIIVTEAEVHYMQPTWSREPYCTHD
jgi:hypothetical protein